MEDQKSIRPKEESFKRQTLVVREIPMVPQREIVSEEEGIIYNLITTEEALTQLLNKE